MLEEDRQYIEKIISDRKRAHLILQKKSPVYDAFLKMEEKTYNNGSLNKKQKELIALGISVVINCESCMEWHLHEAMLNGATEDEILETLEVGIEMGGGPATVSSRFALKVLEYYSSK